MRIQGAWIHTPIKHFDTRGYFHESFKLSKISALIGSDFVVKQSNVSISMAGVVRGIHWADVPPGQAKFISCFNGKVWDFVVDLRVGSPTFGQWDGCELSAENSRSVLIESGLGHGFVALENNSLVSYLCSEEYSTESEKTLNPFDEELAIPFEKLELPISSLILSHRDSEARDLMSLKSSGLLPLFGPAKDIYPKTT